MSRHLRSCSGPLARRWRLSERVRRAQGATAKTARRSCQTGDGFCSSAACESCIRTCKIACANATPPARRVKCPPLHPLSCQDQRHMALFYGKPSERVATAAQDVEAARAEVLAALRQRCAEVEASRQRAGAPAQRGIGAAHVQPALRGGLRGRQGLRSGQVTLSSRLYSTIEL